MNVFLRELSTENSKDQIRGLEDKTGFMGGDTPAILDIAMVRNLWVKTEK